MHKASLLHYWWFIRQKIYLSQWLNCPVNFGIFCEYAPKKPCYVTWIEFYAQMKSHLTWWVLKLPCVLNILCSKVSLIFQVNSFQSIQCWNYYGSIQNPTWSLGTGDLKKVKSEPAISKPGLVIHSLNSIFGVDTNQS